MSGASMTGVAIDSESQGEPGRNRTEPSEASAFAASGYGATALADCQAEAHVCFVRKRAFAKRNAPSRAKQGFSADAARLHLGRNRDEPSKARLHRERIEHVGRARRASACAAARPRRDSLRGFCQAVAHACLCFVKRRLESRRTERSEVAVRRNRACSRGRRPERLA